MTFFKSLFVVCFAFILVSCGESSRIEKIKHGVVGVETTRAEIDLMTSPPSIAQKHSIGSGFFIQENFIVTNYHVISDRIDTIKIYGRHANKPYEAELVFKDELTDVAVLKIKDWENYKKENKITYLQLASRDENYTSNEVMTIGHPWGMTWTVSRGIISSELRRPEPNARWFIQTDANVFPGNSGGPLLTLDGKVLGINTLMIAKQGGSYGLTTPTPLFMKVINDLEKYGEVRWISVKLALNNSGQIMKAEPDGAGAKAGLQVYDKVILIKSGNVVREITSADQLIAELCTFDYQDKVEITVLRNDEEITLDLYPDYKLSSDFTTSLGN